MENMIQNVPAAVAFILPMVLVLMVVTNIIVEVLKKLTWGKLPTNILAFLVAMAVTLAADITVSGVAPLAVAKYAHSLLPNRGGVGLYATFTHVDVRPVRTRWDQRSGKQVIVSGF